MINLSAERKWWYKQIHLWLNNPGYQRNHPLKDIIFYARQYGCKYREYIRYYPQDMEIEAWDGDM